MSGPYRSAPPPPRVRWIARRINVVYGEQVIVYTRHRWYWTGLMFGWIWLWSRPLGCVQFKRDP